MTKQVTNENDALEKMMNGSLSLAQKALRTNIAWWAGVEHGLGYSESYQRLHSKYGITVGGAMLLGAREARKLALKVRTALHEFVNALGHDEEPVVTKKAVWDNL